MARLPGGGDRGPGDGAVAHLLPDAGGVLLVSQVDALVVVEGLDVAAVIKWLDTRAGNEPSITVQSRRRPLLGNIGHTVKLNMKLGHQWKGHKELVGLFA